MGRPVSKQPTELELRDPQDPLGTGGGHWSAVAGMRWRLSRDLTYQSVMTILDIMEDKGYVRRKKIAGSFEYRAKITHHATSKNMMQDLVARLFGGSSRAAVLNLLEMSDLSDSEIAQLRQIVQKPPQE